MLNISEFYAEQWLDIDDYLAIIRSLQCSSVIITLFPGRCGSTFFAKMIGDTGFCGTGNESFNQRPQDAWQNSGKNISEFMHKTIAQELRGGVFWVKITPERFFYLQKILDNKILSSWNYTVMLRRDILAQAISYVYAVNSGVWQALEVVNEGMTSYLSDNSVIDHVPSSIDHIPIDSIIKETIERIVTIEQSEKNIKNIIRNYSSGSTFVQAYEDLATSPHESILHFFTHNDIKYNVDIITKNQRINFKKIDKSRYIDIYNACFCSIPWIGRLLTDRRRLLDII